MLKSNSKKTGFTLIEALVSLGVFSIVVVAATGVIMSIISSNKKNQAISSVVNNLNYSIESMIRDINTGYDYRCYDNTTSDNTFSFISVNEYKLDPDNCDATNSERKDITLVSTITGREQVVIYRLQGVSPDQYIEKITHNDGAPPVQKKYPLTDNTNISINKLVFQVKTPLPVIPTPGVPDISGQPGVYLLLTGTAKVNQINISDFFIQTYISQRVPNLI